MNMYNFLPATQRLEAAGLPRKQAEAIAGEINNGSSDHVTQEQLVAALDKTVIKMSVIMAAMLTLTCTIVGTSLAVFASIK